MLEFLAVEEGLRGWEVHRCSGHVRPDEQEYLCMSETETFGGLWLVDEKSAHEPRHGTDLSAKLIS